LDPGSYKPISEGSRIDANPLCFSYDTDLEKNKQGTRSVQVAPGTPVDATAWLGLIRTQSDHEVARRLGITDRQVRRIKTGKVSEARMPVPDLGTGGTFSLSLFRDEWVADGQAQSGDRARRSSLPAMR
jgi:hypothetical protein